jgi:hypothetical protein
MYADKLKAALIPSERRLFGRLRTPRAIQDYLDTLPVNFELTGETYMSPRRAIQAKKAHCLEGALIAAAALAFHGKKPFLMDFQTAWADEDHVVTLFQEKGRWGALSKTNHSILRYRDPIYMSVRELAMSYFHEYFMHDGRKSLRRCSEPYDLSKYPPERWVTASEELFWLVEALDASPHFPLVGKKNLPLRKVSKIEIATLKLTEWKRGSS